MEVESSKDLIYKQFVKDLMNIPHHSHFVKI